MQLIVLIVLLVLSGFFSSAETAFGVVNRVKMQTLSEEGNKQAKRVNKILEKPTKMLNTILICNNVVNLSASALATVLAQRINLAVGIMTGILTLLILLFGEIVPKNWAAATAEKVSMAYSGVIYALLLVLTPIIFVVDKIAWLFLKMLKVDPNKRPAMTESELRAYVNVSREDDAIEPDEKKMIDNVLDFTDADAKDIMIPRVNMTTIGIDATYEEVMEVFKDTFYTRIPVHDEDDDNMVGTLNIKDMIMVTEPSKFSIKEIMREPYFTFEHVKNDDLMYEMQKRSEGIAFVLNEYGETVGMITMEDLLEEIVGEIRDEYDEDEEEWIKLLPTGSYEIEASMKTDDINDALGTQLSSEEYDSIGGILIEMLDRCPKDGEEVTLPDGTKLKADGVESNRISKVVMTLPPEEEDVEEEKEKNKEKD